MFCFYQKPSSNTCISSLFKTLSSLLPLRHSTSPRTLVLRTLQRPLAGRCTSPLPSSSPPLLHLLPALFCCHMGRLVIQPGRGGGGGVLRLIRPSLLKELLLLRRSICLPRLAPLLINAGHLLFSPTLPPSLVTPPSHLALSRGSSLNYLNYILILLLLGSPNVSHPAISATFSLLSNGGDTLPPSPPRSCSRSGRSRASALCADIGKDIRVEIVAACAAGCSARLRKEVRVT